MGPVRAPLQHANLADSLGKTVSPKDPHPYHFAKNKITYPIQEMVAHSDTYNMGVICRELARHLYSRIPSSDRVQNLPFYFLWHALDGIRVNKIISGRYAGIPQFMQEAYRDFLPDKASLEKLPRSMSFAYAFMHEWATGKGSSPFGDHPEVKAAVDEARAFVEQATRLPQGVDLRFDDLTKDECAAEALASFEVIREKIWPIFERLFKKDLEDPEVLKALEDWWKKQQGPQDEGGEGSGAGGASGSRGQVGRRGKSGRGGAGGRNGAAGVGGKQGGGGGGGQVGALDAQIPYDPLQDGADNPALEETRRAFAEFFQSAAGERESQLEEADDTTDVTQEEAVKRKGTLGHTGNSNYSFEDQVRALDEQVRLKAGQRTSRGKYQWIRERYKRVIDDMVQEVGNALQREDLPQLRASSASSPPW